MFAPQAGVIPPWRKALLTAEFLLLFVVLPGLLALRVVPLTRWVLPLLWLLAGLCLAGLWIDPTFRRGQLGNLSGLRSQLKRILLTWACSAAVLAGGTWLIAPERFGSFVRTRPGIWAMVMLLYPLLSVYPQSLIYRAFLFHRYRAILPAEWMRVAGSALAFGFMHLVFRNALAPLLTLIGGALFAYTYARSRSLLASTLEHALYGQAIFTIGLGRFFFHGAAG